MALWFSCLVVWWFSCLVECLRNGVDFYQQDHKTTKQQD